MASLSTIPLGAAEPQNDGTSSTISVSETWASNQQLDGQVIVTDGATLTINGDITISDDSSIIVQDGGTLALNGNLFGQNINAALRVDDGSIIHADFGSLSGNGQLIINFELYTTQYCNITIGEEVTNVSSLSQVEIDINFNGSPFDIVFEMYSYILPEITSIQSRDVNGAIQTIVAKNINQTNSSLVWNGEPSFDIHIEGTMNSQGGELHGANITCAGSCFFENSTLIGSAPLNVENGTSLSMKTSSILGSRTDEDIVVHDSAIINYDLLTMTGTGGTTDAWIRLLSQRVSQTNLINAGATVHYEGIGWSGHNGDNVLDENGRINLGTSESRRIIEWVNGNGVYSSESSEVLITLNSGITTWNHGYSILITPAPSTPYHEVSIDLPLVSIDSVVPEDTSGTANIGIGVMVTVSNTGTAPVTTNIRCYEGDNLADTTTLLTTLEIGETKKIPTTWWANSSGSKSLTCKALVPIGFNLLSGIVSSSAGTTSNEISFKNSEDKDETPIILYGALLVFVIIGTVLFTRNSKQQDATEVNQDEVELDEMDEEKDYGQTSIPDENSED